MRKKTKIYQYAFLLIGLFSLPILAFGQDLGSSNELFNNPKTKKTTKTPTKKAAPKKATVAKKTPPKIVPKTVRKTTPAKRKPTKTATKTQIAAKPPTATPPTNIVIKVGDKTTGDYDEFFERAIEEGNAARDERQYTKAEAAYLRAQSVKIKDSRAIYGLGNLYSDQQRWEEAERAYRAAIQLEPSGAEAYTALSFVLTQPISDANLADRYAEAEEAAPVAAP